MTSQVMGDERRLHSSACATTPTLFRSDDRSTTECVPYDLGSGIYLTLSESMRKRPSILIGRLVDVTLASAAIAALLPVIVCVALLVRLTSRGPVIFRHLRLGKDAEPFYCLKFRTMRHNAGELMQDWATENPDLAETFARNYKLDNDPRITRVGRSLRKYSLDEIPQFFNVIRGEMSLVGPRPMVPEEGQRYSGALRPVLSVNPGMTGAWQTSGRSEVGYPERVVIDLNYIEQKSLILDLSILAKTPQAVFSHHVTS